MGLLLDAFYCGTLLPHYLYNRFVTNRYGQDTPEKLGCLPAALTPPANSRCLWIHSVSVGETLAARPLAKEFSARHPEWQLRHSTTTATGREVAGKHFGAEKVFYYPLDLGPCVRRAFDIVKPSLIVLMELEVWPNFLAEAAARNIPVVVANVRITERSTTRFAKFGNLAKKMLGNVTLWASQSEEYADRLRSIGVSAERIKVVGSIKYDGLDMAERPEVAERLRSELGGGRLVVAGSTHEGEEAEVYAAFVKLREEFGSELRLVLVPRHPDRCDGVEQAAPKQFKLWRRSKGAAPAGTDIVLGDTMGELAGFYRAAEVAFVGGSFLERVGGHNMLEPAAFAKPTVYGPQVYNFAEHAAALEEVNGAVRLPEGKAKYLAEELAKLLRNPAEASAKGARARQAVAALQGATARTLDLLEPLARG